MIEGNPRLLAIGFGENTYGGKFYDGLYQLYPGNKIMIKSVGGLSTPLVILTYRENMEITPVSFDTDTTTIYEFS